MNSRMGRRTKDPGPVNEDNLRGTVLITGGAGFIGANFVRRAVRAPETNVVVLDKLTYAGNLASLRDCSASFQFVEGDIADPGLLSAVFKAHEPDAVVNLAAETHVDRSIDGPRAFVATNLNGTFELLDAARTYLRGQGERRSRSFRFVHVSTDEVYGSLGPTGSFTEDSPYAPNSPYSATKAGADHLVRAYYSTYELPAIITNCSNNFGPYQYPEKLIPLMILNALEGRSLPIYGDGGNVRDWLYVEDHCDGIWAALTQGRPGERYNIGGGNERSNIEVVDTICGLLDELCPARANPTLAQRGISTYAELKSFVDDRPGHDRRYAIDASKAKAELGWCASIAFAAAMRRTVEWYLGHRDWCATVQNKKYDRERLGATPRDAKGSK